MDTERLPFGYSLYKKCHKVVLTFSGVGLELFSSLEFGFLLEAHPPHALVGPIHIPGKAIGLTMGGGRWSFKVKRKSKGENKSKPILEGVYYCSLNDHVWR